MHQGIPDYGVFMGFRGATVLFMPMDNEHAEEQRLIHSARQGDREAFGVLLTRYYPRIYRLTYRWLGHPQDAEDAAQDVCVKLARSIRAFRGDCAFASWVHGITLNTLRDRHRGGIHPEVPLEESHTRFLPDPGNTPEQDLLGGLIVRCIRLLPDALRMVILLVHGEGLTHRQAGEVLVCAEGTISWRLSEARTLLTRCLEHGGKKRGRA